VLVATAAEGERATLPSFDLVLDLSKWWAA
jgi:hypothetical protein